MPFSCNAFIILPKSNDLITGYDLLTLYWEKSQPNTTVQPPSVLYQSLFFEWNTQSLNKQHLQEELIL